MAWVGFGGAVLCTFLGIFMPGLPWLLFGPSLVFSSWLYGHLTGVRLGANVLIAMLLAGLAFGLDMGIMSSGISWAFLKAFAVFFMAQTGSTYGWMHMVRKILEAHPPPDETTT